MFVYVISIDGQPLMPTERCGKVRRFLKQGKAKVVKRCPFTIQLLYETGNHTQPITLGVDAGSKVVGLSATTESKELYAAHVQLRTDVSHLLSKRRTLRRARRSRLRHRKARFLNRVHSKPKGWVAPSVQHKINTHLDAVARLHKILPITDIVVEVASFDIQKIKNPDIHGVEYQQGEQMGFWNVREYVLFRDGHVCKHCKGKSKDPILNVHHIESRQTGGNAPNNLITLCETCHKKYHRGEISLSKDIKCGMSFRDAAFMGIMRWAFYGVLKATYPNVLLTYGYITKDTRIRNHLPKEHCVDARCISGHPQANPLGYYYLQRKVRRHNRKLYKEKIRRGGNKKRNQGAYCIYGYHLFDRVRYQNAEYFVFAKRTTGMMDIRTLDGTKVNNGSIGYKHLTWLEYHKSYITARKMTAPPTT
jgi:hypothetical protein